MEKIPVTIITGFLGAGKTTLLNHIINTNKDKKIAIIENEFGTESIDSELIVKSENGIFELTNGCVCCSLNGELVEILSNIINQFPNISHLIIETTGIADPGPVAYSFLADYKIQSTFKLNAIITLVDAQKIELLLEETVEANKQIIQADVVLINKIDLVDDYQKDVVTNIIKRLNPQADILFTQFGKIDTSNLLNINAFLGENIERKTKFELNQQSLKPKFSVSKTTVSVLEPQGKKHVQHSDIQSYSFVLDKPLDVIRFDTWINAMLNGDLSKIYRVKGILHIEDFGEKVILQSVGNKFITEGGGTWADNEIKKSRIVFIGKNLDHDLLESGLNTCVYNEDSPLPDSEFYESIMLSQVDMFLKTNNQANRKEN